MRPDGEGAFGKRPEDQLHGRPEMSPHEKSEKCSDIIRDFNKKNAEDAVNHPSHYNQGKIEVIEALEDWKLEPHEWNAVKYVARAQWKGKRIEDLEKAIWYLRRKIALLRGQPPRPNDMPQERV